MKERPILFSAPMVRAILAGTKTQTRRIMKPQPTRVDGGVPFGDGPKWARAEPGTAVIRCPYGVRGDRLWVRETFQPLLAHGVEHWKSDWKTGVGYAISYPATDGIREWIDSDDNIGSTCSPSIHMPRWASRITLEITDVRVERLREISHDEALAEGVAQIVRDALPVQQCGEYDAIEADATELFAQLWERINGAGSWDDNPWVWVIEFERITSTKEAAG